jgi:hypothetical protein
VQPTLSPTFVSSPGWSRLSPAAQGVLKGILELAIHRDGAWCVDGTPKELSDWFGRELSLAPAKILGVLRELDDAGYLRKGRRGVSSRFILSAPLGGR